MTLGPTPNESQSQHTPGVGTTPRSEPNFQPLPLGAIPTQRSAPAPSEPRKPWVIPAVIGAAVVLALAVGVGVGALWDRLSPSGPGSSASTTSSAGSSSPQSGSTGGVTTPTATAPVVVAPPAPARAITAREWQMIAKNPDGFKGDRVIIYGKVTQFDAATGTTQFRASVDGVEQTKRRNGFINYPTNTLLAGQASDLNNIVADDLFRAEVTVAGTYTYNTTLGGSTTVPVLVVTAIQTR